MALEPGWKVLLVDDDGDDYVIIRSIFGSITVRKVLLEWSQNSQHAVHAVEHNTYDAILVDYHLGPENGLELIQAFARSGVTIPKILISGLGGYEVDLQAMRAGASFYFNKNELSPTILERTIRYAIEREKTR